MEKVGAELRGMMSWLSKGEEGGRAQATGGQCLAQRKQKWLRCAGAEIVLQCLRAEGVDLVFGYPGGAIMPLYDALEGSGVRHILTRHEQGAVFAAEGYARATGKAGVAMATSGPGATNLVTGIADAKMDSVPLVCITGQVRSALIGTDAFQETDVFGMTLSLTKWSRLVKHHRRNSRGDCGSFLLGAQRPSGPGDGGHSDRPDESEDGILGPGQVHAAAQPGGRHRRPELSPKL